MSERPVAGLNAQQRDAIVRRCAGLIATYFTNATLRTLTLDYEPAASPDEIEFHDYLRLATLLPAGKELSGYLARLELAPAAEQTWTTRLDRGRLTGPIDPAGVARRFGQRTSPRVLPVRHVTTRYATPENVVAASAAAALVEELQRLIARTQLPPGSAEAALAVHILDAAQAAVGSTPLTDVYDNIVDLRSEHFTELLAQVDERWRTRRISNRAYADIARWSARHRHRHLAATGTLPSLAYGDDFDNRLFEIFSLSCVRSGLERLGYLCTTTRPLHLAGQQPAMTFVHPDSAIQLDVHFQRADGVAWSTGAPRTWAAIIGIPDVIITASSSHPIILIDAKNRNRGSSDRTEDTVGRHATSEEAHKMLGYFTNFTRRCRIGHRGPVGGLIYASDTNSTNVWHTGSDAGGLLATVALDPNDPTLDDRDGAAAGFVASLLEAAGLLGGTRPDGSDAAAELRAIHLAYSETSNDPDGNARSNAIHAWMQDHYAAKPTRIATAERTLETYVLGAAWQHLTVEERQFLATAEVFWEDHAGAANMDFGPVVIEIAKAFESLTNRTFVAPFRQWCAQNGQKPGTLNTIGDVRAELQRVTQLDSSTTNPRGARVLADYLDETGLYTTVINDLLPVLTELNPIRREAAHPSRITSRRAADARAWLLGVGPKPSAISRLALLLSEPNL